MKELTFFVHFGYHFRRRIKYEANNSASLDFWVADFHKFFAKLSIAISAFVTA